MKFNLFSHKKRGKTGFGFFFEGGGLFLHEEIPQSSILTTYYPLTQTTLVKIFKNIQAF